MESEQKLPLLEQLRAATVYEDESGYEVVNLPDGWALGCSDLLPLLIETLERAEKAEALNAEHVKRIEALTACVQAYRGNPDKRHDYCKTNVPYPGMAPQDDRCFSCESADALLAAGTKETH